jgi:hypothetical protein
VYETKWFQELKAEWQPMRRSCRKATVCGDPAGEPLDVMGEIQDLKGKSIANAVIDV